MTGRWHHEAWRIAGLLQLAATNLPATDPDRALVERLARALERAFVEPVSPDASDEVPAVVPAAPLAGQAPRH